MKNKTHVAPRVVLFSRPFPYNTHPFGDPRGFETKIIKGKLTIHGITKEIDIKTTIEIIDKNYIAFGDFDLLVKDFEIKIPPILSGNIAKTISVKFRFQYQPYEE